jgi:hypothetical protein
MKPDTVVRSSRWLRNVLLLVVLGGSFSPATTFAFAAVDSGSCSVSAESRQLDFWLGDWTVTYPGMPGSAASKVFLDLDKCLFVESWDGGKGHSGKNMFAYSSDDKSWRGMFADNQGRVHVFEGKVALGSAEFTGPSRGPDGQTVLNRIKVVRLAANKVEQSWEKSKDNGATWTMEFHGEYSRKNL